MPLLLEVFIFVIFTFKNEYSMAKTSKSLLAVQDRIEERQTRLKRSGILTQAFKVFRKYLEPIGCTFGEIQKRENGNCHFLVHRPISMKIETLKAILEGYGELLVSQQNPDTLKVSVSAVAAGRWNTNEKHLIQKFVDNLTKINQQNEKKLKQITTKKTAVGGPDTVVQSTNSTKEQVISFLKEKGFTGKFFFCKEKPAGVIKTCFRELEKAEEFFVLAEDHFGKGKVKHKDKSKTVSVFNKEVSVASSGVTKTVRLRKKTGDDASEFQRILETLQKFSPKSSGEVLGELWEALEKKYPNFELLIRTRDHRGERNILISLNELKKLV
jgi:hypothetical protein